MPALNILPTPAPSAQAGNNLAALNAEAESGDSFSVALAREMHADPAPDGHTAPSGKKVAHDRKPHDRAETASPEAEANLLAATAYPTPPILLDAAAGRALPATDRDSIEMDTLNFSGDGVRPDSARTEQVRADLSNAPLDVRPEPSRTPLEISPERLAEQLLSAHTDQDTASATRLPPSFAPTVLAEIIRSLPQSVQASLATQYPAVQPTLAPPVLTISVPESAAMDHHLQGNWLARALQNPSDTPETGSTRTAGQLLIPAKDSPELRMVVPPENTSPLNEATVPSPEFSLINAPGSPAMQSLMESALAAPAFKGSINAPLDHPGWGRALGQQLNWMVSGQHQTAELNLHPADLGPMQVVLTVENRQAELMFVSREPAVREAIENALPHLRDMLANAGIQLGQANVSAEQTPRQAHDETRPRTSSRELQDSDSVASVTQPVPRRGQGLVDMFA